MIAHDDVAAHAAREIHDHIDLAVPNPFDDFTVVPGFHAECTGLGFTHVNVDYGRAGLSRRYGCGCNLSRGDRAMRALGDLGVIAGDGARNDDVVIHGVPQALDRWQRLYFIIFFT